MYKRQVYIRAEYPLAVERLKIAIRQAKEYGLLGENIFGTDFSFDIEIRYGAGAFVCGEETALIHSMEGLRGEATVKPPFPSEHGYKGCPTNVNNVETYANIPVILLRGCLLYTSHSYENYDSTREVWCRNIDSSYKGVAAEVDLMMKITNSVFISVGCNTVNFKYLDLNAGLGVFF